MWGGAAVVWGGAAAGPWDGDDPDGAVLLLHQTEHLQIFTTFIIIILLLLIIFLLSLR